MGDAAQAAPPVQDGPGTSTGASTLEPARPDAVDERRGEAVRLAVERDAQPLMPGAQRHLGDAQQLDVARRIGEAERQLERQQDEAEPGLLLDEIDAELAPVEVAPDAERGHVVKIVADEDAGRAHHAAVVAGDDAHPVPGRTPKRAEQRRAERRQFADAVALLLGVALLDQKGIDPDRGIVDEDATVEFGDVDGAHMTLGDRRGGGIEVERDASGPWRSG